MEKNPSRFEILETIETLIPLLNAYVFGPSPAGNSHDCLKQLLIQIDERLGNVSAAASALHDWSARVSSTTNSHQEKTDSVEMSLLAAEGLRLCAAFVDDFVSMCPPQTCRTAASSSRTEAEFLEKRKELPGKVGGPRTPVSSDSVLCLKGCGPKTAEKLSAKGFETLEDLAMLIPVGYEDRRTRMSIGTLSPGQWAACEGIVEKVSFTGPPWRKRMRVVISDETGSLILAWFRFPPGYASRFNPGDKVCASGKVFSYKGSLQIAHPEIDPPGESGGIIPRYPVIEGISRRQMRSFCACAADLAFSALDDGIPHEILLQLGLPGLGEAVRFLHNVDSGISSVELETLQRGEHPAQKRLVFRDIFLTQLEFAKTRASWASLDGPECTVLEDNVREHEKTFGFTLTDAQKRCIGEIRKDLTTGRPMQRLLQGDVGSGKTAVAFCAVLDVLRSGYQVAVMAPTEILALQHFETFKKWCSDSAFSVMLLTGSTRSQVRITTQSLISSGDPAVLVGTHALLSGPVVYGNLGLVVIDEQQRFGVEQRRLLRNKGCIGATAPHLLVMTATPIPRSLALSIYGDLDLSVIDEMPPGRRPAITRLYTYKERRKAVDHLKELVSSGLSAYVVCPLVSESDKLGVADAERTAKRLTELMENCEIGLIHGRLGREEKERVLNKFREKEIQILVATTVIEVGVDVPSAAVMMVINAERFGLAQLHQLRGRIGRSASVPAHCILLTGKTAANESLSRLDVLTRTNDGFIVAEEDLKKRGPGELSGRQQAGLSHWPALFSGINLKLFGRAREIACRLVEEDPDLNSPGFERLRTALEGRKKSFFGAEAG